MFDLQQTQTIGVTIRSLLAQCNVPYEATPFNHELYQECIDEAVRRGYPVDGDHSVLTYLREGVFYAITAGGHHTHRPTQIWIALYTSTMFFVNETTVHFPSEIHDLYLFNKRFIGRHRQGNTALDALADLIHQAPALFQPIPSNLIITSSMNFVTANVLEYETTSMQIFSTAQRYPTYQRTLTGVPEAVAYMMFPREIPLIDYVQAIPDIMQFINDVNDVLSFYKEEVAGESTNQISILAARNTESKLETFNRMAEAIMSLYKEIVKILEGSLEACETFKRSAAGLISFHISSERYRLADLGL